MLGMMLPRRGFALEITELSFRLIALSRRFITSQQRLLAGLLEELIYFSVVSGFNI